MKVTQCDICGEIDNYCLKLVLPFTYNQNHKSYTIYGKIVPFEPKECDVCQNCQKRMFEVIERGKYGK